MFERNEEILCERISDTKLGRQVNENNKKETNRRLANENIWKLWAWGFFYLAFLAVWAQRWNINNSTLVDGIYERCKSESFIWIINKNMICCCWHSRKHRSGCENSDNVSIPWRRRQIWGKCGSAKAYTEFDVSAMRVRFIQTKWNGKHMRYA